MMNSEPRFPSVPMAIGSLLELPKTLETEASLATYASTNTMLIRINGFVSDWISTARDSSTCPGQPYH